MESQGCRPCPHNQSLTHHHHCPHCPLRRHCHHCPLHNPHFQPNNFFKTQQHLTPLPHFAPLPLQMHPNSEPLHYHDQPTSSDAHRKHKLYLTVKGKWGRKRACQGKGSESLLNMVWTLDNDKKEHFHSFALHVSCASAVDHRRSPPSTAADRCHLPLIATIRRRLPLPAVDRCRKVLSQYPMIESRRLPLSLPLSAAVRCCLPPSDRCSLPQAHGSVKMAAASSVSQGSTGIVVENSAMVASRDSFVIQDRNMGQLIGKGHESRGLYYLSNNSST
ncbi:hypothetical protein CR513_40938, partial [Mucuna pruriens]